VSAELEDAREELRVVRLQHDQAITELEKQLLMRPETHGAADTTEMSQELEATQKDLYYYKQSYRELKRKLKQIQVAVKNDLDKSTKEVAGLQTKNTQLEMELNNLKEHLKTRVDSSSNPSLQPVRMSRRDLNRVSVESVRSSQNSTIGK